MENDAENGTESVHSESAEVCCNGMKFMIAICGVGEQKNCSQQTKTASRIAVLTLPVDFDF